MGEEGREGTEESDSAQGEMNWQSWVMLWASPNPKARNGIPPTCWFLEHCLLPPPISSWRRAINASLTALWRDVLTSFCQWERDGIAAYLDCLFSPLLNIHMNTSEVLFFPLPWMKNRKRHLVWIFLPRKRITFHFSQEAVAYKLPGGGAEAPV